MGAVHVGYKVGKGFESTITAPLGRRSPRDLPSLLRPSRDGLPVVPERQTVEDFLASWLENAKPSLRDQTHSTYEVMLRLHAVPYLGIIAWHG